MMNIISSVVNSVHIVDGGVGKDTSVKKSSFQNVLLQKAGIVKRVSKTNSLKPYARNEIKEEIKYQPTQKVIHDDSRNAMAILGNTAMLNTISQDIRSDNKEKLMNLKKIKNAYHIQER
jgi:hypothetical protein